MTAVAERCMTRVARTNESMGEMEGSISHLGKRHQPPPVVPGVSLDFSASLRPVSHARSCERCVPGGSHISLRLAPAASVLPVPFCS